MEYEKFQSANAAWQNLVTTDELWSFGACDLQGTAASKEGLRTDLPALALPGVIWQRFAIGGPPSNPLCGKVVTLAKDDAEASSDAQSTPIQAVVTDCEWLCY